MSKLIESYELAVQLPIQQGHAFAEMIKQVIYKKTGLDKLQNDIMETEKTLGKTAPDSKELVHEELHSLYKLHIGIKTKIDEKNDNPFSYQGNKEQLETNSIYISKMTLLNESVCKSINELILHADHHLIKLNNLVSKAEIAIIEKLSNGRDDLWAYELSKMIEKISPLDLYPSQPRTLEEHLKQFKEFKFEKSNLSKLVKNAHSQTKNTQDIKFLSEASTTFTKQKELSGFSEKKMTNLAHLLGKKSDEIQELIAQSQNGYYYFSDYPLIDLIKKTVSNLEGKNQKNNAFLEKNLSQLEADKQEVLSKLHNTTLDTLGFKQSPIIITKQALGLGEEITMAFPVATSPEDELPKRQWLDIVLPPMGFVREQIMSLLKTDLIDNVEKQAFIDSYNKNNNTYTITGDEPLLFSSMKSVLNMLARFESICLKVVQVEGIRGLLQLKSYITKELNGLLLEIDDFQFQLNEIKSTGLALFSSILSDPLEKMGQLITPALSSISTFINGSGFHSILNLDNNEISSKLSKAIAIIQNVEDNTKIKPFIVNLGQSDDELLQNMNENLDIVNELLQELKKTKGSLVKISESGNRLYVIPIIKNLFNIYNVQSTKIAPRYSLVYEKIVTFLKDDIFKSSIGELFIQSELTEARLGLTKGTLSKPINEMCEQYEKIVYNPEDLDASLIDERLPYTNKRIMSFNEEYQSNEKKYTRIEQTLNLLKDPDAIKSVSDLFLIRKTLAFLPPRKNHLLLDSIEESITRSIGLDELNQQIKQQNPQLTKLEFDAVKEESKYCSLQIKSELIKSESSFLCQIKNAIDQQNSSLKLPLTDINQLRQLYAEETRPSLNQLCNDLIHKPKDILLFITEKTSEFYEQNKAIKAQIAFTKNKYDQCNGRFINRSSDVAKSEGIANDLRNNIANQELKNEDILYYNSKSNATQNEPLPIDISLLKKTLTNQIISDLNELGDFYIQSNINLSDYVEDLKVKSLYKKEEMQIQKDAQNEIEAIENAYSLTKNSLMTLVFGNTNKRVFAHKELNSYKKSKFSGLMMQIQMTNNADDDFRKKYGCDSEDENTLLSHFSERSAGITSIDRFFYPIGRFFRWLFNASSKDDLISYLSEHYTNLPQDDRRYEAPLNSEVSKKLRASMTLGGSSALIAMQLNAHPVREQLVEVEKVEEKSVKSKRGKKPIVIEPIENDSSCNALKALIT